MRKILFIISIFTSIFSFAQDGALKTLTATTASSNTYTITEALPSTYSSKERWQIIFQNANTGSATLERIVGGSGLGAKTLKKVDGSNLSANDIRTSTPYLIAYNGTNYICETCSLISSSTGNLTTSTSGITITGGTGAIIGAGTTINIQNSTNSLPGLLTSADHTSFNAKVDRAGDAMSGNLAMGSNKITGLAAATTNGDAVRYEQLMVALPTGSLIEWPTTSAPTGWLICDGSAVNRTTYASLFAVIGTTFGVGDGSTTFNLPNTKGKFSVGYDGGDSDYNAIAKTGGEKTHTLITSEMPTHSHTLTDPGHTHLTVYDASGNVGNVSLSASYPISGELQGAGADLNYQLTGNTNTANTGLTTSSTTGITMSNSGSGSAHENRPPFITFMKIIKY